MSKTLSKAALLAKIALCFAHNPKADKLHVTEDGNCFLPESLNAAKFHANSTGLKLHEHSREDYEKEIEEALKGQAASEIANLEKAVKEAEENLAAAGEEYKNAEDKAAAGEKVGKAEEALKAARAALKKAQKK